ncbi:MAG TPA: ankyrin repeat domain-containing protein [Roseateles sp.]
MAEFDPIPPKDEAEAAYAQALLADDAGREQRRARLMAALPRPQAAAAVPVAPVELAWRWQPYALGLLATGLLLAAVLALKDRSSGSGQKVDPRLAAAAPASTATVVAQAEPAVEPRPTPAAAAPPVPARIVPAKPIAVPPPAVVVADASLPRLQREAKAAASVAAESARLAIDPPPAAPPPVMAVAPPPPMPAAPVAAAPKPAEAAPPAYSQAESLARADSAPGLASGRARMAAPSIQTSLAASEAGVAAKLMSTADASLLAAVIQSDAAISRSALQAGASVHLRDVQGRTVLMLAARTGARDVVDLLLAAGARKADRDPQGWTAADHARDQGHEELAERLR